MPKDLYLKESLKELNDSVDTVPSVQKLRNLKVEM